MADDAERINGRMVALALARGALTAAALFVAFLLLPVGTLVHVGVIVWLIVGAVVAIGALVLQLRAIVRARSPELRAIEAICIIVPLVVIGFATVYLILSLDDPGAFNERLDKVGALYFTVSTLATVGFGDIHAVTAPARILVTVQMLVGLGLVGVVVRLVAAAVSRAHRTER